MDLSEIVKTASRRAYWRFRRIPGCILEREDFDQIGLIYIWLMGDRIAGMRSHLAYTILLRRMIDYGRRCLGMTRREALTESVTTVSIDILSGSHDVADPSPSMLDRLIEWEEFQIAGQLQWLLFRPEVGLTPRQISALQLYYVEGLTMRETGNRCGMTERLVSFHVRAGVEKVKLFISRAA